MIPLPHYHNVSVAVLGLGKSGLATAAALQISGAHVVMWDDKAAFEGITLTHYEQWDWNTLSVIVVSPGIPLTFPTSHPVVSLAKQHGVRLTCDISLLMEACPDATYIGITGTNGKSTTTALITHLLKTLGSIVQCGGNIGIPVLSMPALTDGDIYVLELSSYQLDLMDAGRINIACLLNITPDHLDRHGDMASYIAAKQRIFTRQMEGDSAIIATDDAITRELASALLSLAPNMVQVSTAWQKNSAYYVEDGELVDASSAVEHRFDLSIIATLRGTHNHQNALIAYAACRKVGYDGATIFEAMRSFEGLAHRMERVATVDNVLFINDSKATNADAAEKSLTSYRKIHWIVGGVPKAGGIESLTPHFKRVKHAYCIGEAAEAFSATLAQHGVSHSMNKTLGSAVHAAFDAARGEQNTVVLLAPAAASFDQFDNFEARGDAFKALVAKL